MKRLILLEMMACLLVAPVAQAQPKAAAATFESKFAEATQLAKDKGRVGVSKVLIAFEEAVKLARDGAQKARALGEVSVLAMELELPAYRQAAQASCDALSSERGAARASHLYNLGRVAEALQETTSAAAIYRSSLALRPNEIVSSRLAKLGAPATTAPAPATDAAASFCKSALTAPPPVSADFQRVSQTIATQRQEKVVATTRQPLGPSGELFQVAHLCDSQSTREHGAWLIEVDATHRFLFAIDLLDGHSEFDACDPATDSLVYTGRGKPVALHYKEGGRGFQRDYYVAVRQGRPVIIHTDKAEDLSKDPTPRATSHDPRGPYPAQLMNFARLIPLDEKGMTQVGVRDKDAR